MDQILPVRKHNAAYDRFDMFKENPSILLCLSYPIFKEQITGGPATRSSLRTQNVRHAKNANANSKVEFIYFLT